MNRISTQEKVSPSGEDFTIALNPLTGYSNKTRKGTIAAKLNIALSNKLLKVEGWLNDRKQLKRIYVALLYIQHYADEVTVKIKTKLHNIKESIHPPFLLPELNQCV